MNWFGFRRSTSAPSTRWFRAVNKLDNTKVVIAHNAKKSENASATSGGCSEQAVCFWPSRQESWLPSPQFLGTGLFRQAMVAQVQVAHSMHHTDVNETRLYTRMI